MEKHYYEEAGVAFSRIRHFHEALKAYKEALNVKEMMITAYKCNYSENQISVLCQNMAG